MTVWSGRCSVAVRLLQHYARVQTTLIAHGQWDVPFECTDVSNTRDVSS